MSPAVLPAALRSACAGAALAVADLGWGTIMDQGRCVPWGGVLCALDQMLRAGLG